MEGNIWFFGFLGKRMAENKVPLECSHKPCYQYRKQDDDSGYSKFILPYEPMVLLLLPHSSMLLKDMYPLYMLFKSC
jgi:hypothetical protein